MNLLITYLIAVTIGVSAAAWLGVIIDRMTTPFISLSVFFPLFFLTIWATWRLSVKLTEPKATA